MVELETYWPIVRSPTSSPDRYGAPTLAGDEGAVSTDELSLQPDAVLVEAAQRGQTEAFDKLVVRHQRGIYRVCYRFAPTHEDANDLTQETFLRAYRALGTYRGQAAFKTWLYRIAVNVGLTRASAKGPVAETLLESMAVTHGEVLDEDLDQQRQAVRVRDAVARLPPRQRAAIVLKVLEDRSHEEAARMLGCSVGTVKANVFHALKKLRGWLAES